MNPARWFAALALACALPVFAQLEDADPNTRERCRELLQTPFPAEATQFPNPHQWPDCQSYRLYSGIGTKVDYAAARKCAWSERLAETAGLEPRYSVASVFGGSAMLAVLYANGEGVPRDLNLAERFVCEAAGAPAEISIRLDHVDSLAQADTKFSFCDDITSGFMQGFCAAYSSEIQDQKRANMLKEITSKFTHEQQDSFDTLIKSQSAYAQAHARGEIDLSGTARAMFQIDAEDSLTEDFVEAVRSFESGSTPSASATDHARADEKLNAAYRNAMKNAETNKDEYGAVQPDGIRNAERAWLTYRDAFVAFAGIRYPVVPKEAWLTLLTKTRTSVLDGSFCGMDDVEGPCATPGDTWKPSPLP